MTLRLRAAVVFVSLSALWQPASVSEAQSCRPAAVRDCEAWLAPSALLSALATEGLRCDVAMRCTGGRLHLDDAAGTSWELGTIPAAVRARVLALLVTERLRGGDDIVTAQAASDPPIEGPSEGPPTAPPAQRPASTPPGSVDITPVAQTVSEPAFEETLHHGDAARDLVAESSLMGSALDHPLLPRRAHPGAAHIVHETEMAGGTALSIGLGTHLYVFLDPITALAGPSVQIAYGAVHVELGWAFGQEGVEGVGRVDAMLGHVSTGVNLVCGRWSVASICGSALATLGYARAGPDDVGAEAPYAGAGLALTAWLATDLLAANIGLRGGWGYGLIVGSESVDVASVGGLWFGANLGLALEPFR